MLILRSEASGETIEVTAQLRVGRDAGNDLVLPSSTVSSFHAVIEARDGGWHLRDLGSSNGTAVGADRIVGWTRLKPGARVQFGPEHAWVVERAEAPPDVTPRSGRPGVSTVKAGFDARPWSSYRLTLTQRADFGDIELHDGVRAHRWTDQDRRFLLLWVLGDALRTTEEGPAWVDDEAIKLAVWGRRAAEGLSGSTLSKLIHDTRAMLGREGLDGHFIEKRRGRTRLCLSRDAVALQT